MKKFINILFKDEIKRFKGYTKHGKRAYVYFITSFSLFCISVCSNSIALIILLGINLLASTLTALHYIPDFEEDC